MYIGYITRKEVGMMARKTQEQFVKEVKERFGSEFEVVSEYVRNNDKVSFRHKDCGLTFERSPSSFFRSGKCPNCNGRKNWNTEKVSKEIKEMTNGEYTLVGKYRSYNEKVSIKHNRCGRTNKVVFYSFLYGVRCPKCSRSKRGFEQRKSQEDFEKEVFDLVGEEYRVKSKYTGAFEDVLFEHSACGSIFEMRARWFIQGGRCPDCSEIRKWDTESFKEEVSSITKNEYKVIGDYKPRNKGKIKFSHNECGREFEMLGDNFLKGQRCPFCKTSKGEQSIRDILERLETNFVEQFKFDDCVDKAQLPFDFAIFKNGKLKSLIEYDGIQHFRGWHKKADSLKEIQRRDNIKNEYCKRKNIKLIRIPYTKFSEIESIITKEVI